MILKIKKYFIALFIFSYPLLTAQAQPWMEEPWLSNSSRAKPDFKTIQSAFSNYWKNRPIERSKGWKPFKRWEYFWQSRVDKDGKFPSRRLVWNEWKQYRQSHPKIIISDSLANWKPVGPFISPVSKGNPDNEGGIGRINCFGFDPNKPAVFYAGSPSGGFWKTTNGGANWFTTTDELLSLGVKDIAVNPKNPTEIFIATGDMDGSDTYSIGVLKSVNGGINWEETGLSWSTDNYEQVGRVIIHPINTDTLLAATSAGIYRSENGGNTWSNRKQGQFNDMEFNPTNPDIVYAVGSGKVYRSVDNGKIWSIISSGLPSSGAARGQIAVTPANPDFVYALFSNSESGFYGMYRSEDAGVTWSKKSDSPNILGWDIAGSGSGGQGWYDLALAASPGDQDVIFAGGVNIWKSSDGGTTWSINAFSNGGSVPYVHADIHALEYSPFGALMAGCDGGVFYSSGGNGWEMRSDGMQITQYYRIAQSSTNPRMIMGGAQDNGTSMLLNNEWIKVMGADGMDCQIDFMDDKHIYASWQNGNFSASDDYGETFRPISPSGGGAWVTPIELNPVKPSTIYIGYNNLFRSYNRGVYWQQISDADFTGDIQFLKVAPSDTNVIYVSTWGGFYKTIDGGTNWINISSKLPSVSITKILIHPDDSRKIWLTNGYSSNSSVYESTNGGDTWQNISGTLPNISANCIQFDPGSNDGLYLGTDLGVFYRNDSIGDWIRFNNGLPNVIVNELEIYLAGKKVRAGTYGRGIWESNLFYDKKPIAGFTVNKEIVCSGEPVYFYENSATIAEEWQWTFYGSDSLYSTLQNPVISYKKPGKYPVELIVKNKFGSDILIKEGYVTVLSTPVADFTVDSDTVYLSRGGQVSFTNKTVDADTFYWEFPGEIRSYELNPVFTFTKKGGYYITLVAGQGDCSTKKLMKIYVFQNAVDITENMDNQTVISVYPNPMQENEITIFIQQESVLGKVTCSLLDLTGKRIAEQTLTILENEKKINWILPPSSGGLYFVNIQINNSTFRKKLVRIN
ncbi:MAG: hypothetical protein A3H98_10270 [Bacteroidetes bacterium RIFCSPLOWO2_02_FULL_36_8]|nr:MAG: hypothetical protein A3H98_10270 [Bacteroidetes bacterium RIFCSPLOWO2_02_FULL_36_8]OFY68875.1 MAG: hypothetical protein A3G23_03570 [Bacteroidetes bacterium RIFCSPLOWO2_12_FULL_37_12]